MLLFLKKTFHKISDENKNLEIDCRFTALSSEGGQMMACLNEDGKEKISEVEVNKKRGFLKVGGEEGWGVTEQCLWRQINTLRICGPLLVTMGTGVFNRKQVALFSPWRLLFIMSPLHCSHSGGSACL